MKTYIVCSQTNHDLMIHVVNAQNKQEAIKMAESKGAWPGCTAHQLDTKTKGVVFQG